jgi:hypothetical protein
MTQPNDQQANSDRLNKGEVARLKAIYTADTVHHDLCTLGVIRLLLRHIDATEREYEKCQQAAHKQANLILRYESELDSIYWHADRFERFVEACHTFHRTDPRTATLSEAIRLYREARARWEKQ